VNDGKVKTLLFCRPWVLQAVGVLLAAGLLSQRASGLEGEERSSPKGSPRLAILIDDLRASFKAAEEVLSLPAPLTLAILPRLPYSRPIAEEARRLSREVLLHLPMEPHDLKGNPPGPGALLSTMDRETFLRTLEGSLSSVPHAVGVNNHMGSKLTEIPSAMEITMNFLRARGLFYVDSLTSPRSVAFRTARALGVPAAQRQVFLDHELEDSAISARLEEAVEAALRRGKAIAIGHPHPKTLAVLRAGLPRLWARGVKIVPLSELLEKGDASPRD
jgi:polysaccharide deacetylase 2 family uncharacterized protein YibQ